MSLVKQVFIRDLATTVSGVLSLKGKDLIYGKNTCRHGWIGKATKITENGAVVMFRNGTEQSYQYNTFIETFCPAHWSNNQAFRAQSISHPGNRTPYQQEAHERELAQRSPTLQELREQKAPQEVLDRYKPTQSRDASKVEYIIAVDHQFSKHPVKHVGYTAAQVEAARLAKANLGSSVVIYEAVACITAKVRTEYTLHEEALV